jgi:hypothetical protein
MIRKELEAEWSEGFWGKLFWSKYCESREVKLR